MQFAGWWHWEVSQTHWLQNKSKTVPHINNKAANILQWQNRLPYGKSKSQALALCMSIRKMLRQLKLGEIELTQESTSCVTCKIKQRSMLIQDKLRKLCSKASPGDSVVFYFSGHGTQGKPLAKLEAPPSTVLAQICNAMCSSGHLISHCWCC